eukprot:TRINITY_DN596_c0_g1_i2.p1 TRINITY_DN596_c0_g1~~TRINITY_DN596_c0_g1_i2.p1  ORF type:complete len:761 (+),score=152.97 TRINITY_DN596_c0_g1_i2:118-2283(+)
MSQSRRGGRRGQQSYWDAAPERPPPAPAGGGGGGGGGRGRGPGGSGGRSAQGAAPGGTAGGSGGRKKRKSDRGAGGLKSGMRKTQLCRNWQAGGCAFGEECGFAHGEHELQQEGTPSAAPGGQAPPSRGSPRHAPAAELRPRACAADACAVGIADPSPPPPSPRTGGTPGESPHRDGPEGFAGEVSAATLHYAGGEACAAAAGFGLYPTLPQQQLPPGGAVQWADPGYAAAAGAEGWAQEGAPAVMPLDPMRCAASAGPAVRQHPLPASGRPPLAGSGPGSRRSSAAGWSDSPPGVEQGGAPLSDHPQVMQLVLSGRRSKAVIVCLGDEPALAIPGVGMFSFHPSSLKNAACTKLHIGSRVDCRLSQSHPPRAVSLRLLGEAAAAQSEIDALIGTLVAAPSNYTAWTMDRLSPMTDPLSFTQPCEAGPNLSPPPRHLVVNRCHSMPVVPVNRNTGAGQLHELMLDGPCAHRAAASDTVEFLREDHSLSDSGAGSVSTRDSPVLRQQHTGGAGAQAGTVMYAGSAPAGGAWVPRPPADTPEELLVLRRQLEALFSKGEPDPTYGDPWWSLLAPPAEGVSRPLPPVVTLRMLLAAAPGVGSISAAQHGGRAHVYDQVAHLARMATWPIADVPPPAVGAAAALVSSAAAGGLYSGDPAAVTLSDFSAAFESLASLLLGSGATEVIAPARRRQVMLDACTRLGHALWAPHVGGGFADAVTEKGSI